MKNFDIDNFTKWLFRFSMMLHIVFVFLKVFGVVDWRWSIIFSPILVFSCFFIIFDDSIADS